MADPTPVERARADVKRCPCHVCIDRLLKVALAEQRERIAVKADEAAQRWEDVVSHPEANALRRFAAALREEAARGG